MEQVHGHEVLAMMQGKSYTEESLKNAIDAKFGKDCRFYTCCAENLTAQELITFLKDRGKFMPMGDGFTFDESKKCSH